MHNFGLISLLGMVGKYWFGLLGLAVTCAVWLSNGILLLKRKFARSRAASKTQPSGKTEKPSTSQNDRRILSKALARGIGTSLVLLVFGMGWALGWHSGA